MREVLFWGATGQAKVLHEAIQGTDIQLAVLVDNRQLPAISLGVQVVRGDAGLDAWLVQREATTDLYYTVAVGGGRGRERLMLMDTLQGRGLIALSIVHRTSFVASNALLGAGCQILAQAAVCAGVRLGRGVIVNTAASVDHDCKIDDGVHIAPGARLAGEVTVGKRAFIGTGAIVLPRVRIGEDAVVGAGSVVLNDVPSGVTIAGNPTKVIRTDYV
jgi:sugar O-acyltransferase (sialic acid O-acetyltransferase NeuD family)